MAHYRKSVNTKFFDKWSSSMAYVLGYFAADGSMYINSHGAKYVGFTSTDLIQLENVKNLLRAEHQVRPKSRNNAPKHWKPAYQIQIGGGELFEQLEKLGFTPNKELSLKFPNVPTKYLNAFVRGYFDGDGCISFGWYQKQDRRNKSLWIQASFASGSLEFLRKLDEDVRKPANIAPGYLRRRNCGCYLYYQRRKDICKLYNFLYSNGISRENYLPRKYEHFTKAVLLLGV